MVVLKIVSVNIPQSYLEQIENLVGTEKLYPSRSELIRVALREFLIREIKTIKNGALYKNSILSESLFNLEDHKLKEKSLNSKKIIKVPVESIDEDGNPDKKFKTYEVIGIA